MASKKVKNILYSIGTIGAAITPVATVLSCGSSGDDGARVHDQTPADAAKAFIVDAYSFIGNGKVMQVLSPTTSGGQSDEGDSPEVSTANLVVNADATDSTAAAQVNNQKGDFTTSLVLGPNDNFDTVVTREAIKKAFIVRDVNHNKIDIKDEDININSNTDKSRGVVRITAGDGKKKIQIVLNVSKQDSNNDKIPPIVRINPANNTIAGGTLIVDPNNPPQKNKFVALLKLPKGTDLQSVFGDEHNTLDKFKNAFEIKDAVL
ncbi:MAG: hypothetical protein DSZ21_00595, partial [Tenericutes bacterium]